jgi:cell division protein FtsQ
LSEDRSPRRRFDTTTPARAIRTKVRPLWLWLLAATTLVLAGGGTYAALRLPWFQVHNVEVLGAQTLDATAIADITGLKGKSILDLNFATARKEVLQVPQVRSVAFSRAFPGTVKVRIVERRPWGFWSVGGKEYPIDIEGVVLVGGAPSGPSLRIAEPGSNRVMGPGDRVDPDAISFAVRIAQASPTALGQIVKSLEYQAGVGVTVVFNSGLRVTFGDDRAYDYKVAVLSKLLEQLKAAGRSPSAVDLRFGERVTYE